MVLSTFSCDRAPTALDTCNRFVSSASCLRFWKDFVVYFCFPSSPSPLSNCSLRIVFSIVLAMFSPPMLIYSNFWFLFSLGLFEK